jgi:NADH dehydrogenase
MIANPLATDLHVPLDPLGRLPVNQYLQVTGVDDVLAGGDIAAALIDNTHSSVMSCQHARPMGRFAGYNAVASLLRQPLLPLQIPWYVTVVDLGDAGALYTEGWDRHLVATGSTAKNTKRTINRNRIYPPRTGSIHDILIAAAPIVQRPPEYGTQHQGLA